MKKQFKKVAATLLAASLLVPVCSSGNVNVSNAAAEPQSATTMDAEDDGSSGLTEIPAFKVESVDKKIEVKVWKDKDNKLFYSAYRNGHVTLKCAPLGLKAKNVDLSTGLTINEASVKFENGTEEYDWFQGSRSHVNKEFNQMSFMTTKGNSKMKVIFKVFNDGFGYRYEVDGDTTKTDEVTEITSEESSFEFPADGTVWCADWYSSTYEPGTYSKKSMTSVKSQNGDVPPAILCEAANGSGKVYMLLAEANVYNEEKPYCATIFHTNSGSGAYKVQFSKYLKQEQDPAYVGKTFQAEYLPIKSVLMENEFHTPWRLCIMTDTLNDLTNSSLVSDLNPAAEGDYSWVEPGTASWSWWSTGDPVEYTSLYGYIDYAQRTGQKYCLVDFGWENWDNYEQKLKDLCAYANERNVGILVWYGVKKRDNAHRVDLDNPEIIEKEFAWCESLGIKGVKVDYLESDSQWAMKDMYDVARIAAKHKLVVNYHGCTDPNGENRTFPNILASEAVEGSEFFKWGSGSPIETLLTLPFTRNVIGSMEFTPVATRVKNCKGTDGFMLGMTVVYESAMQTLAHSAYVYPGYGGLSFLTDLPSSWDDSVLLEGSEPRVAAIRARKKGDRWYLGAMTAKAKEYEMKLDFLDKDTKYYAYIYTDKDDFSNIQMEKKEVTSNDKLTVSLKANGGCAAIFSKKDDLKKTYYDNYNYFEAEDANLGDTTTIKKDLQYVSRQLCVDKIRSAANRVKFENIEAPEAGMYELQLYVVSNSKKKMMVRANNYESVQVNDVIGIPGNTSAVGVVSTKVYLDKGVNTLYIYNTTTGPILDKIAVSKTKVEDGTAPKTVNDLPELYKDYKKETATPAPTQTPAPTEAPAPTVAPSTEPAPTPVVAAPTVSVAKVSGVKAKSKKLKATISWKKVAGANGYQVVYTTDKKVKKSLKKLNVKKNTAKTAKLKKGKKYFVKVRAYVVVDGKKVYGKYSKVLSFKAK